MTGIADISQLHRAALSATRPIVAGVRTEQWGASTPCADWNVRALINHVVAGNLWAAELANGATIEEIGDRLDGDQLGGDPTSAYDRSAEAAAAAFERSGALDEPCAVSYGPVPGSVYAGHRFIDVLIHGWDIARATDQNTALDPWLVEAAWGVFEPQEALLQASGMFGSTVDVAPDSAPQTRLLAALGRGT